MRKLASLIVVALLAVPMAACEDQPTELSQDTQLTPNQGVKSSHGASPGGMIASHTWGNDHLWRFLIPKSVLARLANSEGTMVFEHPSDEASLKPIYEIGPDAGGQETPHSLHPPSPHDHVMPVPPDNEGSFTANCRLKAVFANPEAEAEAVEVSGNEFPNGLHLAHAADIDDDGMREDLTSAEKVQMAAEQELVTIFSSPLTFTCPVKDIEG